MKKVILFTVLGAGLLAGGYSFTSAEKSKGRIKIYLQNKCSSDYTVYVTASGGGTTYTIDDNTTKPFELLEGSKVMDKDQRELFVEVKSSCEGKTYVVCD